MSRFALLFAALTAFTCLALAAPFASAQSREAAPQERAVEGADLDAFIDAVHTAAREAGADAPSRDAIVAAFEQGDANGDGTLDAAEQQTEQRAPARCDGRGICRMGQCFCAPASRTVEEPSTISHDNPTFIGAPDSSNNILGQ